MIPILVVWVSVLIVLVKNVTIRYTVDCIEEYFSCAQLQVYTKPFAHQVFKA